MIPAAAWICSITGLAVAWVYLLGLGMSTVPGKLSLLAALGLSFLPIIAILAILGGFSKSLAAQQQAKAALIYVVPLLVSLFTLFQIFISYDPPFMKWIRTGSSGSGGMSVTDYERNGSEPHFQMEIRPVFDDPTEGTKEISGIQPGESYHVGEEIIFTNADVESTYVKGPYSVSGWVVGVRFTEEAQPKVDEFSRRDLDKRWAILIDGKVLTAPQIKIPFSSEVIIEANFIHQDACNYARGIVQEF